MNVYDFDGTLYLGDSSIDFYKFCFKKKKKCLLILPKFLFFTFLYFIKVVEKEKIKSVFFSYLKFFKDINELVDYFWQENIKKINNELIKNINKKDYIISASPEFLINGLKKYYDFNLIATIVNEKNGNLKSKNCYGQEKVNRLKKKKIYRVEKVYSDSMSDYPLMLIAKDAYIVKNKKIIPLKEYHEKKSKIFIKKLLNRDFTTFLFIGIVNVFNGVVLALIYNLFIKNTIISYVIGFISSMSIAYLLNSKFNFRTKLSWSNYFKFAKSNIPNFIIQILSVIVLIELLNIPKIFSYLISAIISVPITFLLIKLFVFNKKDKF